MKKILLAIFSFGVLATFFLTIIIFAVLNKNNTEEENTFTLYKEYGTVYYKSANTQNKYTEITEENINLENNSWIQTKEGMAIAILPDNSMITIDENTEIQININTDGVNVFQQIGNTWHRVQKVLVDNKYEVETSNTLASVRGTKFGVNVTEEGESDVMVGESIVDVAPIVKENGQKILGEPTQLTQGKFLKIKKGLKKEDILNKEKIKEKLQIQDIPEEILQSKWHKINQEIDKEFDKHIEEFKENNVEKEEFIKKIKENKEYQEEIKPRIEEWQENEGFRKNLREKFADINLSEEEKEELKQYMEELDKERLEEIRNMSPEEREEFKKENWEKFQREWQENQDNIDNNLEDLRTNWKETNEEIQRDPIHEDPELINNDKEIIDDEWIRDYEEWKENELNEIPPDDPRLDPNYKEENKIEGFDDPEIEIPLRTETPIPTRIVNEEPIPEITKDERYTDDMDSFNDPEEEKVYWDVEEKYEEPIINEDTTRLDETKEEDTIWR